MQLKHDPCLFTTNSVICLCDIDDCLFFAKDGCDIDDMIESLHHLELNQFYLNIEDDVAGFLGILMSK